MNPQWDNYLNETSLQGIMVVVLIKTNILSNVMNTSTMVPCRRTTVCTIFKPSKAVPKQTQRVGINDSRWTGLVKLYLAKKGQTILYSGHGDNQHQEGAVLILAKSGM